MMGEGGADSEFATFVLARSHGLHTILLYILSMSVFQMPQERPHKMQPLHIYLTNHLNILLKRS